jgi:predicted esterase/photosystem II stability/assembly factor-like uncharacterized protein
MQSRSRALASGWLFLAFLGGCGDPATPPSVDSGPTDSGAPTGEPDASPADAGVDGGPAIEIPCQPPGTHLDQDYEHGGETRHYLVHVPTGHRCGDPLPMWVDLHGTAGARPEEAYGLDAMIDLADREGVLIARPRSRFSSDPTFGDIYRWDQNIGDLDRNAEFIEALTEDLARAYDVDRDRMIVSGFSSGSNMSIVLLERSATSPFTAYGLVAGGAFAETRLTLGTPAPRIYASTGYRDYLHDAHVRLLDALSEAGLPEDHLLERETDGGHDLYPWHFEEMWAFFARGERAVDLPLAPGYTRIDTPTDASLLSIDVAPDSTWLIAGEGPTILRRSEGAWQSIDTPAAVPAWTGVCRTASGVAIAVGGGLAVRSDDGGSTWATAERIPDFGGAMFGYSFVTAVGCSERGAIAAGYWSAAESADGRAWTGLSILAGAPGAEYAAQNAAIARGERGTDIAVGYYQSLARRPEGGAFATVTTTSGGDWYFDVDEGEPGAWVVVGDRGTILRSGDDGVSFEVIASPRRDDLYAVDLDEHGEGMAVGLHGIALHTADGGLTWTDVSPGVAGFLGGVRVIAPGHAILIGEDGLVLERRGD